MRPSLLTRVPVPRRSVPSPIAAETCVSGTCECTPTVARATFSNNRGLAFTIPLRAYQVLRNTNGESPITLGPELAAFLHLLSLLAETRVREEAVQTAC